MSWFGIAIKREATKLSGPNFAITFAVIIGVFALGGAGIFILVSESTGSEDIEGFGNPNSNSSAFTKLNFTNSNQTGYQRFSTSEELKTFLQGLQDEYNPIFGAFYPSVAVDDFVLEESLALARRSIETAESFTTTMDSDQSGGVWESVPQPEPSAKFSSGEGGSEFSTTNIQVKNVDEPDFIKNDGKYLYVLVGNELTIVDAYPAQDAKIVFESDFDIPNYHHYEDMFLNESRLAIIYQDTVHKAVLYDQEDQKRARAVQGPVTNVLILDVSDRSSAEIIKEYSVDGWYHDSRMIQDHVYLITKDNLDYNYPVIPQIRDMVAVSPKLMPDVYYFDGIERPSSFTTISAISLDSETSVTADTYLLGSSDTIFVSKNNIFLTFQKHYPSPGVIFEKFVDTGLLDVMIQPISEDAQKAVGMISEDDSLSVDQKWQDISKIIESEYESLSETDRAKLVISFEKEMQRFAQELQFDALRTVIHKIAIVDTDEISFEYVASAEVLGHVLNQFSMDEHDGKFRIATSVQSVGWRTSSMYNNVYVLDEALNLVGSLEEIAPEEKIYSARFMADKLYLVTFRQIDPFFVIDLSNNVPKILGELKIPGFSNYLQPYGKDHVVGIGRDVGEDGRIRGQNGGVKIAMFDVSDFNDPKLKDEVIIGKSGTWSVGLDDHKAILLDERKEILSIPISHDRYSIEPRMGIPEFEDDVIFRDDFIEESIAESFYPDYEHWNGFYVFSIDENKGFEEKGKIRHDTGRHSSKSRSLYIEDSLYTVTDHLLKINDLNDLDKKIKSIVLN